MKPSLVQDLLCPSCAGALAAIPDEILPDPAPEILSGWLLCQCCGERYPIIGGVPRLLVGKLRETLAEDYPDFFRNASVRSTPAKPDAPDQEKGVEVRTMKSFGYEWKYFSDIRPEGEANFRWYFEGLAPEGWAGKNVLDVGCGKARHLSFVSKYAKGAIGVDVSSAVDAAYQNTRHLPNAHVIQADLFHLPLAKASFDFVYSLGVLHHLPAPEAGFQELLRYGRPDAQVLIYLYWSLQDAAYWKRGLLALVTQLRRITTRLPFGLLRVIAWVVAAGGYVVFVLPYKWLSRAEYRDIAEKFPLRAYANYPFRVLYQDQFDRLSAPVEHRFNLEEVTAWFSRAGLSDINIVGGSGWRARGRVPRVQDEESEKSNGKSGGQDTNGTCSTQGLPQAKQC